MRRIFALAFSSTVVSLSLVAAFGGFKGGPGTKGVRVLRSDANRPVEIEVRGASGATVTIEAEVVLPDGSRIPLPATTSSCERGESIYEGPVLPEAYRHHVVRLRVNATDAGKSLGSTVTTIS